MASRMTQAGVRCDTQESRIMQGGWEEFMWCNFCDSAPRLFDNVKEQIAAQCSFSLYANDVRGENVQAVLALGIVTVDLPVCFNTKVKWRIFFSLVCIGSTFYCLLVKWCN